MQNVVKGYKKNKGPVIIYLDSFRSYLEESAEKEMDIVTLERIIELKKKLQTIKIRKT